MNSSSPALLAAPVDLLDRGYGLLRQRQLPEAIEEFNRAEIAGADPDSCAGARWHAWMLLGEMERAWCESDAIRRRGRPDPHRFWQGTRPAGRRVTVRSLHGFGDAVQNLRFLPALQAEAAEVTLQVAPPLLRLARCFAGADRVISWGDGTTEPPFDLQMEITELPYLLRCTSAHLRRGASPYLRLPPAILASAGLPERQEQPRVGLVWQSSGWDAARSVPMLLLEDLLRTSGVELWSLQTAADNGPWKEATRRLNLPPRAAGEGPVEQTAAAIAGMDLLITVDTFAAHLAGALGVPTWLLLRAKADWRWGIDPHRSLWYPSLRLFRQRVEGAWEPVIQQVAAGLREWIETRE